MRRGVRLLSASLMLIFSLSMGMTAHATRENGTENGTENAAEAQTPEEELTPEEQAQKALEEAYAIPVESNGIKNWPQGPGTYGDAAIVMEAGTGAILYAKNIDAQEYPASITKLLTTLIALENGEMDDTVTFSHDSIACIQPGDSAIGMKEGNQLTLEQGLYATLLASANEVAYAVGESVGVNAGHDYPWFLEQMNAKCRELGGENSNFVNTSGLHDPNHYTCARDMALIGRELFKYPEFFTMAQTLNYTIPASETTEEHIFQQHHKMMMPENKNYYEYVIGGKTGFTSDALSTLVTMTDNGDMKLICVVLRTQTGNTYSDTRNLCEYVYSNFQKVKVAGLEESKDVKKILDEEETGYVVLPQGIEFQDLKMELEPDGGTSDEATLTYTYEGNVVGSVRAKLSDEYLDEHGAKLKKISLKKEEKKNEKGWTLKEKILAVCIVVSILLILLFIWMLIRRNRRRRRARRIAQRRRRRQAMEQRERNPRRNSRR